MTGPAIVGAIERLERSTWDSRALPSKADIRILLDEVTKPVTPTEYRGWHISAGRWPEPVFIATHPDYDASYEGEEDGWCGNGLTTCANDYASLCIEVDCIMEEHPHFACPDGCDQGRIWNNADPTSGQWVACECGGAA